MALGFATAQNVSQKKAIRKVGHHNNFSLPEAFFS